MKTSFYKLLLLIIFIIFAIALFLREEYGWSILLLFGLLPIAKLDKLIHLVIKGNGFQVDFEPTNEKEIIEKRKKLDKEIKDNKLPITRNNYIRFQNIESKIIAEQQKKYDGEMKTLIHFVYGKPDKPQFIYTPDASLQTNEALYFFEIKYIIKPQFVKNIVKETIQYLETVYTAFKPLVGKKLIIKLILASTYYIDPNNFDVPKGIEIEISKI